MELILTMLEFPVMYCFKVGNYSPKSPVSFREPINLAPYRPLGLKNDTALVELRSSTWSEAMTITSSHVCLQKFFQHWFFHVLVLSKHSPWLCFGGEWGCVGLGSRQADISRMCGVSCSSICRDGRRGGKGAGTEDDDETGTKGAMPSNRRKRESGAMLRWICLPCWCLSLFGQKIPTDSCSDW